MFSPRDPRQNGLLRILPRETYDRLRPYLTPVALGLGESVYEANDRLTHVYFVTSGIVSLLYEVSEGESGEIAIIGTEGVVGLGPIMGGETGPRRAAVQSSGGAYRLRVDVLKNEFLRGGPFQRIVLRYGQALLSQVAQTAVCNRHHSLDRQLCRWLLLSFDRLISDDLHMTPELIANILGAPRGGLIEAAARLEQAGLIQYRRGRIRLLDRAGLEQRTCACYRLIRDEYRRSLAASR